MLMLHDNPTIFDKPEKFVPDRWKGEEGAKLLSDWVPFQEGSRRCIAIKYGRNPNLLCCCVTC
jgi:cytochrome P450